MWRETTHRAVHHGLLGTVIEVTVRGRRRAVERAEAAAVAEIERLERIFSVYDPGSELSRWRRGEMDAGPEVVAVASIAIGWFDRTGAAFHPAARELVELWSAADGGDTAPPPERIGAAVDRLARLPFRVVADGGLERTGDCSAVDLNAVAKGWIVDRAAEMAASVDGVMSVVVNAGGDLVHRGQGSIDVDIEDPRRARDNAPPLDRVTLAGAAVATSGPTRKPIMIAGRRVGHVVDPRTGYPADRLLGASVIAPDAATADAVATTLTVLGVGDGLDLVEDLDGVEVLLVNTSGTITASPAWPGTAATI